MIDVSAKTISRFKPNGEADPFAALGTNVIDGMGSGGARLGWKLCAGLARMRRNAAERARFRQSARPRRSRSPRRRGRGHRRRHIRHLSNLLPGSFLIDIFSRGQYLGQLTESSGGAFNRACGVAVDPSGAIYVGDFSQGIHKFTPSSNSPSKPRTRRTSTKPPPPRTPCALAAGAKPPSAGGSEGFLFANRTSTARPSNSTPPRAPTNTPSGRQELDGLRQRSHRPPLRRRNTRLARRRIRIRRL